MGLKEKAGNAWLYVRYLFKGRDVVKEAFAQGKLVKNAHAKHSWKSSEFLGSILTAGGAIAAQAAGIIPAPYGPIVAAASASFYAISRGLAKQGDPYGGLKPGLSTTELWGVILNAAGQLFAAISGAVSPETALALTAISNGAYAISRGLSKGGNQAQE